MPHAVTWKKQTHLKPPCCHFAARSPPSAPCSHLEEADPLEAPLLPLCRQAAAMEQPVHVAMAVGLGLDLYREGKRGTGQRRTECVRQCVEQPVHVPMAVGLGLDLH